MIYHCYLNKKFNFIRLLVTIIIFCLLFSSYVFIYASYADIYNTNGFILRVGLNYKNNNEITEEIYSSSGFDLNIVQNGSILEKHPFTKLNNLKIYNIDSYHIRLSDSFSNYADVYSLIGSKEYANCYPGFYNNKWYICYGHYKTKSDSKSDFAKFSHLNPKLDSVNAGIAVYGNGNRKLIYSDTSKLFSLSSSSNSEFNNVIKYSDKLYRGGIAFWCSSDSKSSVINCIDIDEYLYGVVPKEMSGNWHIEALKAQAVAARNFAYASRGKHSDYGFDVCRTTDCQVYYGYNAEQPLSNKAVQQTKGKLLYYDDELVHAYYHANSGGYTASINNVWGSYSPYIVGVKDPYSLGAPRSTWTFSISKNDLTTKLKNAGYNIGKVESAKINSVSADGRVQSFSFIGTSGNATFKREQLRKFLGYSKLKSIYFGLNDYPDLSYNKNDMSDFKNTASRITVSRGQSEYRNNNLIVEVIDASSYNQIALQNASFIDEDGKIITQSADKYVIKDNYGTNTLIATQLTQTNSQSISDNIQINTTKPIAKPHSQNEISFYGCGYGHGLGMSQWGAKKMAELGMDYTQILTHYYQGSYVK